MYTLFPVISVHVRLLVTCITAQDALEQQLARELETLREEEGRKVGPHTHTHARSRAATILFKLGTLYLL